MRQEDCIVALDVGTTGTKAMLVSLCGQVIATGYREYPCLFPAPDCVEQSFSRIKADCFAACKEMMTNIPETVLPTLRCMVFSSQRSTFGLVDENNCIIDDRLYNWQDQRAKNSMGSIQDKIDAESMYAETGMPASPIFALYKIAWIQQYQPDIFRRTKKIVHLGDYIAYCFGADTLQAEKSNASVLGLLDIKRGCWSKRILQALNLDESILPPLISSTDSIGHVTEEVAFLTGLPCGLPLIAGSGDQQCAAIGAGVCKEGMASLTLGTAGFLVTTTSAFTPSKTNGLMVPISPINGMFDLEANQLGAASAYRWIRDVLAQTETIEAAATDVDVYTLMEKSIQSVPAGANGILFLPHLSGCGYPNWVSDAEGSFVGLCHCHTKGDLMRAVMEGITFEAKDMYSCMQAAGIHINTLTITGGATKSPSWRQMIADMFQTEVRVLDVADATLIGAAIIGGVGIHAFSSIEEGVAQMVHSSAKLSPDKQRAETYDALFQIYRTTFQALNTSDVFSQLARFRANRS